MSKRALIRTGAALAALPGVVAAGPDLPMVVVTRDNTVLTESCLVVIPKGTVIEDANNDGVIHIATDGITVEFAEGSVLTGAAGLDEWGRTAEGEWDALTGTGIVIDNASCVTLRDVRVRGYRVGIRAERADGLIVDAAELADMWHPRLGSTATAEDSRDWLGPHANDKGEWLARYGGALAVKNTQGVTLRRVRVRRSQNGIILDRVNHGVVYDCDCSFLSGWGLAMWRSNSNTISRNALDYNIRGHVEGVYNRGQDSAGIVMFEQCRGNVIAENSATHCGDGVFAFAGREAIGESPKPEGLDYADAGINGNVFLRNDLSYASAHGLELTFSEHNVIAYNRFVENAICGIWGGYSSDIRVQGNEFVRNGGMPYGKEGGGINAEHGSDWVIDKNEFINNRAGVHFWVDNDAGLVKLPGVSANYRGVTGNTIALNKFTMNAEHPFGKGVALTGVWMRLEPDVSDERMRFDGNWLIENVFEVFANSGVALRDQNAAVCRVTHLSHEFRGFRTILEPVAPGETNPTERGRKPDYPEPGRASIIMGPWRAWDFESLMLRLAERSAGRVVYELFVPDGIDEEVVIRTESGPLAIVSREDPSDVLSPYRIEVASQQGTAASPSEIEVSVGDAFGRKFSAILVRIDWSVRAWVWDADPTKNRDAWRAEGRAVEPVVLDALDLPFGYGGPARANDKFGVGERDRFGLLAETSAVLPPGRWVLAALSDDGVRVEVNGETVIERWDIHGPTRDEAIIESDGKTPTAIRVEYFENTGYATLEIGLHR